MKYINIILSYRKSPLEYRLNECGGIKLTIKKIDLCEFLKEIKKKGFNEVIYFKWMDEQKDWKK